MNTCPLCRGLKLNGETTFTIDLKNSLIVVRRVPALVCQQCGEIWIEDIVAQKLEKITNDVKKHPREIEVLFYKDAA